VGECESYDDTELWAAVGSAECGCELTEFGAMLDLELQVITNMSWLFGTIDGGGAVWESELTDEDGQWVMDRIDALESIEYDTSTVDDLEFRMGIAETDINLLRLYSSSEYVTLAELAAAVYDDGELYDADGEFRLDVVEADVAGHETRIATLETAGSVDLSEYSTTNEIYSLVGSQFSDYGLDSTNAIAYMESDISGLETTVYSHSADIATIMGDYLTSADIVVSSDEVDPAELLATIGAKYTSGKTDRTLAAYNTVNEDLFTLFDERMLYNIDSYLNAGNTYLFDDDTVAFVQGVVDIDYLFIDDMQDYYPALGYLLAVNDIDLYDGYNASGTASILMANFYKTFYDAEAYPCAVWTYEDTAGMVNFFGGRDAVSAFYDSVCDKEEGDDGYFSTYWVIEFFINMYDQYCV
jgi:hypothetical protein